MKYVTRNLVQNGGRSSSDPPQPPKSAKRKLAFEDKAAICKELMSPSSDLSPKSLKEEKVTY